MKYIFFISLAILATHVSSMHLSYKLPIHATITKRLWDAGFSNFAKETGIGKKLGNQSMSPLDLYSKISHILRQYKDDYPGIIANWDHNSLETFPPQYPKISKLIRIILQDHPSALEDLEQNGWLKSHEKIVGVYQFNWNK